jgi:hypothetical protein
MNELEWLTDERPPVAAPDEDTTAWARAALLAHALGKNEAGPARRRAPRKAPLYTLAAAVFAVAIVVAAGALPSGDGPARRIVGGPAPADAALVTLAERIQAAPPPTGDATLVLRSHHFPDKRDFTGADLYFDDGRYFYGITLAELKQNTDDIGEGVPKLERDAARAAITLPDAQARRKMIDATFGPRASPRRGPESTRPPWRRDARTSSTSRVRRRRPRPSG